MKILKRNGADLVDFDKKKIVIAVVKAMSETEKGVDEDLAWSIAEEIEGKFKESDIVPTVESVSDRVEELLAEYGRFDASRTYILYRNERKRLREKGWEMTDLQRDIYEKKYRYNNETFEEFLDRVSGGNEKIKKLMKDKKFIPAGRILAGRGLNEEGYKVCYSNCFVVTPPEDNLESIFDTAKKMARTFSYGGGCGTNLGNLRPKNAKVNNAARSTTGAVSFADLYSLTTGLIGQAARRGALMLSLPVSHPDLIEFINLKTDLDRVTKANISVMVTDEFMKAVQNDDEWIMKFEVKDTGEVITKKARARDIMRLIAKNNWNVAEPGVLYWDRVEGWHLNSENPNFKYVSTNPCGEKPLPSGGSCMLGSMNLSEYVINPFTNKCKFDIDTFVKDVKEVVIYMNEVLEEGIQYLPLKEQRESAENYRQLGIGVMGLADMFIKMGVTYGEEESLELIRKIFSAMANASLQQSALLAKKYGTYKAYDREAVLKSPYLNFVATKETLDLIKKYGLRNAELLSIAPTGSISTMIGVSGGCEPIFQNSYIRKSESLGENGEEVYYKVYTPIVREYMIKHSITDEKDLPKYFVTAHDLDYKKRIDVQAELQKYVDSAISSTINLPEETTVEEIEDLYTYAWKKGLKGVTIYRNNCARTGILLTNKKKSNIYKQIEELQQQIDNLVTQALQENPSTCPMCGGKIIHTGGCEECQSCGYSPCSV